MIPGKSAKTIYDSSTNLVRPKYGLNVVNGYGAIFGNALVIAASNVLLPAFGNPMKPTSAIIFNLSSNSISSPFVPGIGSRISLRFRFPVPPLPPYAIKYNCPSSSKSATFSNYSAKGDAFYPLLDYFFTEF